ncbi:MAG: hypothetical protein ACEPOW_04160 [Bacteroidales bacterium]
MILSFFEKAFLPQRIVLFLLAVLFYLPSFVNPERIEYCGHVNPAYSVVVYWIGNYPLICNLLSFVLFFVLGIALNKIAFQLEFIGKINFIPSALLLISSSFDFHQGRLTAGLFSAIFVLLSLYPILNNKSGTGINFRIFNSSLLIALGSFFYFSSLWFVFFLWLGLYSIKQLNIRSFLITVLAVFVCYAYLFSYYYFTDQFEYYTYEYTLQLSRIVDFDLLDSTSSVFVAFGIIMLLVGFFAILVMLKKQTDGNQLQRSGNRLFRYFFLMTIPLFFLSGTIPSSFAILALSFSVLVGSFLSLIKTKLVGDIVLFVWVLVLLINNFDLVL